MYYGSLNTPDNTKSKYNVIGNTKCIIYNVNVVYLSAQRFKRVLCTESWKTIKLHKNDQLKVQNSQTFIILQLLIHDQSLWNHSLPCPGVGGQLRGDHVILWHRNHEWFHRTISSDFLIGFCGFLQISKQGVRDFFRCGLLVLFWGEGVGMGRTSVACI